jgi:hypothetical protein
VNSFDVLGVFPWSSDDEVAAAYRQRARQFHPDVHPGLAESERRAYEAAMARINLAYGAVKSRELRLAHFSAVLRLQTASRALSVEEVRVADAAPTAMPDLDVPPDADARPTEVDAPVRIANEPVAAHHGRWLVATAAVVIALIVAVTVAATSGSITVHGSEVATPSVGQCVAWVGGYVAAPCSDVNAGVVVAAVGSPRECRSGNSFTRAKGRTYCIAPSG